MKNVFVLLLIAGLLLSGCTGNNGAKPNESKPSTGTTGTTAGTTPGTNGTTSGSEGATTGTTGSNETTTGSNTGSGGNDLLGKTYSELIGLGIPLKCDITATSNGKSVQSTLYLKGKGEMRSEVENSDAACAKTIMIMKNEKAYIGCEGGSLFPDTGGANNPFAGCVWMEISTNKSTTTTATTGPGEPPDYSKIPPSQISCVPWVYDASKFTVVGKSCNLDDMMKNIPAYGN